MNKRAQAKAELYRLVRKFLDHGLHDIGLIAIALKRSERRIRQIVDDLDVKRAQLSRRDTIAGLPESFRQEIAAFSGVEQIVIPDFPND